MRWTLDDAFLEKTKGKVQKIEKFWRYRSRLEKPLPRWFWIDWLRPLFKNLFWNFAVVFGASQAQTKDGYRLGIIAEGHAYVGAELLHHQSAFILVGEKHDWIFFAVDADGEVIPDEVMTTKNEKRFWVDPLPINTLSSYLDNMARVD